MEKTQSQKTKHLKELKPTAQYFKNGVYQSPNTIEAAINNFEKKHKRAKALFGKDIKELETEKKELAFSKLPKWQRMLFELEQKLKK
jgi:hypothetical protein